MTFIPSRPRPPPQAPSRGTIKHLGKAFFVVAGTTLAHSYFLIERYRPLADAAALASR